MSENNRQPSNSFLLTFVGSTPKYLTAKEVGDILYKGFYENLSDTDNPIVVSEIQSTKEQTIKLVPNFYRNHFENSRLAKELIDTECKLRQGLSLYGRMLTPAPDTLSFFSPAQTIKLLQRYGLIDYLHSLKNMQSAIRFKIFSNVLKAFQSKPSLRQLKANLQQIGIIFDRLLVYVYRESEREIKFRYRTESNNLDVHPNFIGYDFQNQLKQIVIETDIVRPGGQSVLNIPVYILAFRDLLLELHLLAGVLAYLLLKHPNKLNLSKPIEYHLAVFSLFSVFIRTVDEEIPYIDKNFYQSYDIFYTSIVNLFPILSDSDIQTLYEIILFGAKKEQKLSVQARRIYELYFKENDATVLLHKGLIRSLDYITFWTHRMVKERIRNSIRLVTDFKDTLNVTKYKSYFSALNDKLIIHCFIANRLFRESSEKLKQVYDLNRLDNFMFNHIRIVERVVQEVAPEYYPNFPSLPIFPIEYETIYKLVKHLIPLEAHVIVKIPEKIAQVKLPSEIYPRPEETVVLNFAIRSDALPAVHLPMAYEQLRIQNKYNHIKNTLVFSDNLISASTISFKPKSKINLKFYHLAELIDNYVNFDNLRAAKIYGASKTAQLGPDNLYDKLTSSVTAALFYKTFDTMTPTFLITHGRYKEYKLIDDIVMLIDEGELVLR